MHQRPQSSCSTPLHVYDKYGLMIFMFFFLSGEECNSAEDEGIERDSSEMEEPSSAMHPNALTSLTQVLDVSIALERI